jgi:hypothetical protein
MESVVNDAKGDEIGKGLTSMTCSGGKISIDLRNLMASRASQAGKDMEVKIEGDMTEYPSAMTAGQSLSDATMIMRAYSSGSELSTTTIKITDRKVAAVESKTTSAGTWECYKITYTMDMKMKVGAMSVPGMKPMQVTEWFSYKVGTVRSETYKNEKLESYSELTAYKKP